MNKKKILKRAFAVFAIVVVLVSMLLPFGASALEDAYNYTIYDIPFYNYVEMTNYFTTYNDGRNAYIESVNVIDGYFVASADIRQQGAVYIPTSYLKLSLQQVMPDAQVGRTYYLNVNADAYYVDGENWIPLEDDRWGYVVPYFDLMLDGQRVARWEFGQPLTLTQEMLDAYVYVFPYRVTSDELLGKTIKVVWQPWVNIIPNQRFVSYYNLAEMLDNYSYNAGFTDAAEFIQSIYSYLSGSNADWLRLRYNNEILSSTYVEYTSEFYYPFNGYSWFSNQLQAPIFANTPNGYTRNDLREITMRFDFDKGNGVEYILGSSPMILYAQNAVVRVTLLDGPVGSDAVSRWYEYRADSGSLETVDITNAFNFAAGTSIYRIVILVIGLHQEPYADPNLVWYGGISLSQRGIEYDVGFDDGYAAAELENDRAYDRGYTKGNDDGYWRGRGDEQKESGFFGLISAVIDAPIQAFKGLFGFNVMGVDMSAFMLSIITLCLFIAVIKLVI